MAFSNSQKKIFDEIQLHPEKVLEKINNKQIILSTFENEFFQDGRGLVHVLVELYDTYPEKYHSLLKEILSDKYNFSIEDCTGRKNNPIADLIKNKGFSSDIAHHYHYKSAKNLYEIIKLNSKKINDELYYNVCNILLNYNEFDKFDDLIKNKNHIKSSHYIERIIENLTSKDQLERLSSLLSNITDSQNIVIKIKSHELKRRDIEYSNLLVLAINKSPSIANYFLNNFKFSLDGKVSYEDKLYSFNPYAINRYNNQKYAMTCLNESFYSQREDTFLNLCVLLNKKFIGNLLNKEPLRNTENYKYGNGQILLNDICKDTQSIYYKYLKNNINKIITTHNELDNINFFKNLIALKDFPMEEKLYFAKEILPALDINKLDHNYSKNHLLNTLFDFLYKKENLTQKEIELSGEIFNLATKTNYTVIKNEQLYTLKLFNSPKILNSLIAHGLDITYDFNSGKTGVNPFYFYYEFKQKDFNHSINSIGDKINSEEVNKIFNIFKIVAKQEILNDFCNTNILKYALSTLDSYILNNLTDNEIIKLSKTSMCQNYYPVNSVKFPTNDIEIHNFKDINKKLFNLNFEFFKNGNEPFYNLISKHNDYELITNVLKKENKSISELSKDYLFWTAIENDITAQFVKNNGAVYSIPETAKNIVTYNSHTEKSFDLYLKNNGNIEYKDINGDNLLHFLIKQKQIKNAITLLSYAPDLGSHLNKQKKIPLSYMLRDFDGECAESRLKEPDRTSLSFKQKLILFEKYLDLGKFSNEKKSKEFLYSQIEKYSNIKKFFPNIKEIINYRILDSTIEIKEEIKTIRRKI